MHWFDRLSRQVAVAPEARTTRRGMLKGVGAVAVAAPFASTATTYAKNVVKAHQAFNLCTACLQDALSTYQDFVKGCYQTYAPQSTVKSHAGFAAAKKKTVRKTTPAQSAEMTKCLSFSWQYLIKQANDCRKSAACVTGPAPPGTTVTGSTYCPPGTSDCPGAGVIAICCYAGDACCPCGNVNGGYICCAGVIGCTCC